MGTRTERFCDFVWKIDDSLRKQNVLHNGETGECLEAAIHTCPVCKRDYCRLHGGTGRLTIEMSYRHPLQVPLCLCCECTDARRDLAMPPKIQIRAENLARAVISFYMKPPKLKKAKKKLKEARATK